MRTRTESSAADEVTAAQRRSRRGLLGALGGLGALPLLGCGGGGSSSAGGSVASATASGSGATALVVDAATDATLQTILATSATCSVVTEEVEGPYPLRAILGNSAMLRADITEGKTGVGLTLRIKLVDVNNSCAAISGAWVYIWHCDKDGLYSGYDATNNSGQASYTYLRGLQQTDSSGRVTFKTIVPGWYAGRITHIHCMVFLAGSSLSSTSAAMATTQFAFPPAVVSAVYSSSLYSGHGQNTSVASFADDNIFSDGTSLELLTMSGSVSTGYAAGIVLGIDQTHVSASGDTGGAPTSGGPGAPGGTPPSAPPGSPPPAVPGTTSTTF